MTKTGVLLCGHGSRDPEARREFERAAAALRARLEDFDFAVGYLEFVRPTIRDGLDALVAAGVARILAIPAMLLAARHVRTDLPREVERFRAATPGIELRLGRDLAVDSRLLGAAADRLAAAGDARIPRAETLLVVVGRGTSDPAANSTIVEIARTLKAEMGFGEAEAAFSGVALPRVEPALERAATLGFRRIVVFPYFLFTGILVKRIHAAIALAAACFPGIEFVTARHLGDHDGVIDTLVDRVFELAD